MYSLYLSFMYFFYRKTTEENETSMDNPENVNEQHYEMTTNTVVQKARVS